MQLEPKLTSASCITRHGPILTAKDIPYEATCIFNAGVVKWQGQYLMLFRNDYRHVSGSRFTGCTIGFATSPDGVHWTARPEPLLHSHHLPDSEMTRIYDPRLTVLDGHLYVCFACDTRHGLRGGVGEITPDLQELKILSLSLPDNRNMVLFPEKIGGEYVRLERPMPVYSRGRDRFDTWLSRSPDLIYWGNSSLVLPVEQVPFANDKTGPAAPPVKTEKGWLTVFHAVDVDPNRGKNGWEDTWKKRYCAGIMLLDLEDPSKVIGLSKSPLLAPEAPYEADEGFRENVIFPGGMLLEEDGQVKIYYGAADTVECLATAQVDDLLALCQPV